MTLSRPMTDAEIAEDNRRNDEARKEYLRRNPPVTTRKYPALTGKRINGKWTYQTPGEFYTPVEHETFPVDADKDITRRILATLRAENAAAGGPLYRQFQRPHQLTQKYTIDFLNRVSTILVWEHEEVRTPDPSELFPDRCIISHYMKARYGRYFVTLLTGCPFDRTKRPMDKAYAQVLSYPQHWQVELHREDYTPYISYQEPIFRGSYSDAVQMVEDLEEMIRKDEQ